MRGNQGRIRKKTQTPPLFLPASSFLGCSWCLLFRLVSCLDGVPLQCSCNGGTLFNLLGVFACRSPFPPSRQFWVLLPCDGSFLCLFFRLFLLPLLLCIIYMDGWPFAPLAAYVQSLSKYIFLAWCVFDSCLVRSLPPRRQPPPTGENDHDAVRRVGELVTSKVTTIECMVDRICTGRQIGVLHT